METDTDWYAKNSKVKTPKSALPVESAKTQETSGYNGAWTEINHGESHLHSHKKKKWVQKHYG